MAPILKLYKAVIGSNTHYFLQRPTSYAGSIDTATGITEAEETEQDEPPMAVSQLVSNGKLFRVTCGCSNGVKQTTRKLLVTREKLATVFDELQGETLADGFTVISVRIPQKAIFYR